MGPLKHGGLALATSISSVVNLASLLYLYRKKTGAVDGTKIMKSGAIMSLASFLMGAAVYAYATLMFSYADSIAYRAAHLMAAIAIGAVVYGGAMLALGSPEAVTVKKRIVG